MTLNIATLARAREWLWWGAWIAILIAWIELVLSIASVFEPDARIRIFSAVAFALLIAQVGILGITRGAFARLSREVWRAHAFVVLTLLFFLCASLAIPDPVLPLYFVILSVALIYPCLKVIRGLKTIGDEIRSVADPTFLDRWLYDERPALPKSGVTRRRLPRAVPWFVLAACSILLLIALIVAQEMGILRFGMAGLVGPLILIALYLFNRGRRHVKLKASELRHLDQRAPVLILRSFKDDKLQIEGSFLRRRLSFRSTLEEVVAHEAEPLGPPITIGEPEERLPPLGASREYLSNEGWQSVVSKLIEEAALIVFILGDTDNLFWELSAAVARRGKQAILIVVPPLKDAELERRWRRFAEANAELLGAAFPRLPPREPVLALFFRQDDPVLVVSRKRGRWDYALGIRLLLRLYQARLVSTQDVTQHVSVHLPAILPAR
jgi:hypothetical protein